MGIGDWGLGVGGCGGWPKTPTPKTQNHTPTTKNNNFYYFFYFLKIIKIN